MIEWFQNNYIEVIGVILALIYLILEIRQKWTMWLVGIVSSAFYVYIFFGAKLYAEMGLNVYYVIIAIYGLYCWKFAKKSNKELEVTTIKGRKGWQLCFVALALFGLMSYILIRFTDSPVPYPDAIITSFSIIATWMVARKIIEHWFIWIFVNFFSVGLYIYQGLYPTALLFVIYGCMSVVGFVKWKQSIVK